MDLTKESYQQIIANLNEGLYIVDRERKIVFWNSAAEQISGFSADQVLGGSCDDNILCHVDSSGDHLCKGQCPLAQSIAEGLSQKAEIFLHHKDGYRVPIIAFINPLTDFDGNIIGAVEIFSDIRNKIAIEQKLSELEQISMLDRLTQLANRHYLEKELEAVLDERSRYGNSFGVLFMDVDDFKSVNDRYGHETGDQVLKFVAGTLNANSRPFDLYGRWGGEEFIGIVRNVTTSELEHMGERLRRLVGESFIRVNGSRLHVTISVGATIVTDSDTISTLIQRADELMYQSKGNGKNCVTLG